MNMCNDSLCCTAETNTASESNYGAGAKLLPSRLTLCNAMDCSPPGSSVHGILRREYWSGLPCPPPGHLPNPGIEPAPLMFPALTGEFFTTRAT